jgi:trk system potassium uptake protein TrkH
VWSRLTPPQLFVGSFALLIAAGTVGFQVLPGLYTGEGLSWLDALFTAASAVCVTGLIVVDTATYFTAWGQAYVLLLIQLGGLGMIAFTTVIIVVLGRRLSLRHEVLVAGLAEVVPHVDYRHLVRNVVLFTLAFEVAGALALWATWAPEMGTGGAAWPALFHSVSAFCNAGFSVFSDSLVGFQQAPVTQGVVMLLIVIGGIGFLTLEELYLLAKARRGRGTRFSLSLHSRIVLATTAVLVLAGWPLFTLFEWGLTLAELPPWARVLNGLFASVTTRTAGFNTIDYGAATDATNFLTVIFMFIGGSPGSMAGGLKTTTFALVALVAWSRIRGRAHVSAWGRTVPEETIQRAVGLFVIAISLVTVAVFVLTMAEIPAHLQPHSPRGFLQRLFEAFSAFNTVGLSMGVTGDLTPVGRVAVLVLMFLGRVGPLAFTSAIALNRREPLGGFRYAEEDVVVG